MCITDIMLKNIYEWQEKNSIFINCTTQWQNMDSDAYICYGDRLEKTHYFSNAFDCAYDTPRPEPVSLRFKISQL